MNSPLAITIALLITASTQANTYYVATNGNDAAAGTATNTAWRTPERSIGAVNAGDTLYVFGGTYVLTGQVKTAKAGTAVNPCKLWAYPGERPYFNATNLSSGTKAVYISKDFWHVKGIEVGLAPDNGMIVTSGSNTIEGCVFHDNQNDGLTIGSTTVKGHDNLILNCDSYRNFQASSGGNNGDGFSAKAGCGPGNIFSGCRSYLNSDDAWDFYDNDVNTVILTNCWAFMNGSNQWNVGSFTGNGNGFKLGGANTHAKHLLLNCVAFQNRVKGFDYNNSVAGHTMINCTGFRNGAENYKFHVVPANGTVTVYNCISYLGGGVDIVDGSVVLSNSWQNGLSVGPTDFVSLDPALAQLPRNADYSLPTNSFARLAAGSDLIDAGLNVGLPYNGAAPDLGAYEYLPVVVPQNVAIAALSLADTGLTLSVTGLTSHGNVIVHTSPDLATWTPIFTNPPVTGGWQYFNPNATNDTQRFYKVQEQ
jgi:pectate disaccharide-lyase